MHEQDQYYGLVLGSLGLWRITHLLRAEDGPWKIIARLRQHAGNGFWGELLDCFYCLSLWIAAPLALFLGVSWSERAWLWPAPSAGAILLERLTLKNVEPVAAPYIEDPGPTDALLRKTENQPPADGTTRTES